MFNTFNHTRANCMFWTMLLISATTLYGQAGKAVVAVQDPSWLEHLDIVQVIMAILLSLVGFFLVRTLTKIDTNQTMLTQDLKALDTRLSHLEGEHSVLACRYGRRKDDP